MTTCVADVWLPPYAHYREPMHAPCGRPAKGERATPDGRMWPVCGIHLRARQPMVMVAPGRYRALVRAE